MKTVVNQWKKSEGEEKQELLNRLKELTAMKKEVEALL
jgi:predicted nuclease of restriction endonuclease-like RecB superfamily